MRKKKLLFINGHLNPGGCEKSLVDLLNHIDFNSYEVDLLLLEELGAYYNELPAEVNTYLYSINDSFGPFFKCMKNGIKSGNYFAIKFRIIYMISQRFKPEMWKLGKNLFKKLHKNYDVIIAYRPGICTELAAYMFSASKKISWWHHGEMFYDENARRKLGKAYDHMNVIVAVSNATADLLTSFFPKYREKIHVIDNMVDVDELLSKSQKVIHDMNVLPDNTLVSVGRFSPEKNMCLCVDIAENIVKKYPELDFHWYLIGDGQEFEKVQTEIEKRSLFQYFTLLGRRENPYPYMRKAKLFIHPSLVESQGLTILESMSLGVPVIAVASMGPQEYIKSGINGILCNPDAGQITEQIVGLLTDTYKYKTLCINTKCPDKYLPDKIMVNINELLIR